MKISLTYGFGMAMAGALLVMALFFLGFHSDAEKLSSAQTIGTVVGLAISIVCMVMGIREKRALTPADQNWGYGSAFGTSFMIGLFGTLFGVVFGYLYFAYINPSFSDLVLHAQLDKLEASGKSLAEIDQIEPIMKKWINPTAMSITQFFSGLIGNTILALIVSIFLRKRPEETAAVSA